MTKASDEADSGRVPGQDDGEGALLRVGAEIRQLRQARRMTLRQLAAEAGLSIGLLSQLERGRSRLSVANLMRVAAGLGVPMSFFFSKGQAEAAAEADIVVRAGSRRELSFPGLGIREDLLSPNLAGPIEMLLSTIEPGADCGEAYAHRGDEAGFILSGTLDLWVGDRHLALRAGDSFSFPSTILHRYRNSGSVPTRIIWVITPPFY